MALDDQLITRSNQRNNEADNSESGALGSDYEESSADRAGSLREEIQAARNGQILESQGDLRADRKKSSRRLKKVGKDKVAEAVMAPIQQGTSKLLQAAWENLIPSWGLTLFWIDIHVFLNMLFPKMFCDLGKEWLPVKAGGSGILKK